MEYIKYGLTIRVSKEHEKERLQFKEYVAGLLNTSIISRIYNNNSRIDNWISWPDDVKELSELFPNVSFTFWVDVCRDALLVNWDIYKFNNGIMNKV